MEFPYDLAFDRNLGWVTDWEQLALRAKNVAIAGMGGVGGRHLLTLTRLGIGGFTIADLDAFEFVNFNRQIGATLDTLARPKALVMEEMARAINPELRIRRFDAGVTADAVDSFLDGADLFVDGLDFFAISIRRRLFAHCRARGIPAITAAPIGMGVGYLAFTPRGMSFERYFRFEGHPPEEQFLHFLMGLVPRGMHRAYLVDPTRINLAARRGPSTSAAVALCAGVTGALAVRLLLDRGGVRPAPWHYHFDAYLGRFALTRLRFGLGGPVQRAKLALARRAIRRGAKLRSPPVEPPERGRGTIEEILNLARWAPSGDNAQPWRFRILDASTVEIELRIAHGSVYEYRGGEPTLLSAGFLLESLHVAASGFGWQLEWALQGSEAEPVLLVRFSPAAEPEVSPLFAVLTLRSVDRRGYRRRSLRADEKAALEASLERQLTLTWHESLGARWRCARLNGMASDIRLRCPEAFPVHQRVIDWENALSPGGIPARAVGLPGPMLPLLRWALSDPARMRRLNHVAGTWGTRVELDYLPALASAAFVVFRPPTNAASETTREIIEAGRALQRFWLTATRLGLAMQPTIAMLAFAEYGESGANFTADAALHGKAARLAKRFRGWLGVAPSEVIFVARIGEPRTRVPSIRSSRLPLAQLLDVEVERDGAEREIRR